VKQNCNNSTGVLVARAGSTYVLQKSKIFCVAKSNKKARVLRAFSVNLMPLLHRIPYSDLDSWQYTKHGYVDILHTLEENVTESR
jgi:hypothetical protein